MTEVFGTGYAAAYDELYRDKPYEEECDVVERIWAAEADAPVSTVLDLGCGTGGHALPLARRGYRVTGVDRSEEMLVRARSSAQDRSEFVAGDIRNLDLERTFDAALMLFAVLGYQLDNADAVAALATARRHLRPGGILVFDVWYGPAVVHERPSDRVKIVDLDGGRIVRAASAKLDGLHQRCTVSFHLWRLEGRELREEVEEDHVMRYFFPQELELLLERAGFALVRMGTFPDLERAPDETTWNVLVVARAV